MPPRVVCIDGNIGAGKTTAVRALAEAAKVTPEASRAAVLELEARAKRSPPGPSAARR